MGPKQILVVNDEVGIRELLSEILYDEGYQVVLAENAEQARGARQHARPDLVLLDIWMPDTDGISLLREWASTGLLTMPVVMMSGHGTIDTAVEATRIGATDFLEKPITLQKLLTTVSRVLKHGEAVAQPSVSLVGLGKSILVNEMKKRLSQIAHLQTPLLLLGEAGAGAEMCARFLHQPNTPWVEPESLSNLADNPLALLEQARDGVLFLAEVAQLGKMEQKGLLLLLGKQEKFNVRVICASSQPLPAMVHEGIFNGELFHAMSAVTLTVPGLREHREDIPELASAMLDRMIEDKEVPQRQFTTGALNALRNYNWPGNLPQMRNVVRTLALTSLSEEISAEDSKKVLAQFAHEDTGNGRLPLDLPLREARDEFERVYFEHHIRQEGNNMSRVAEKVGLERTHLYRKLKQLGIKFSRKAEDLR